jgi:glycosyltransferase involved in cell wall biosynthesis
MATHPGRILLNDTILSYSWQRGVARYFQKVAAGVIDRFGSRTIVCSPAVLDYGPAHFIKSPRFRGSYRLRTQEVLASLITCVARPTVVYSPYYGELWANTSQVFTVYDMIHELVPDHSPGQDPAIMQRFITEKRRCLERGAALLAISEHTARDIVACYPHIDPTKIVVTHLGVDDVFFDANLGSEQQSHTVGRPYFLYVGNRTGYKNFKRLLIAYGQSGLAPEFDLRVISPHGSSFTTGEQEIIRAYRLHGRVRLIHAASEVALRQSYAAAVALVYPSEYEGFGLPILEAMASGTLVATSNVSSMPEVGGEVALYFAPRDTDEIAERLRQISALPAARRAELVARGIDRARTFTWARCQQQSVDVLAKLVGRS